MKHLNRIYIDGAFAEPHGDELFPLYNPATEEQIGVVRLGDAVDARRGIAAAKRAFPAFARTTKKERIELLRALHDAVSARVQCRWRCQSRGTRPAGPGVG